MMGYVMALSPCCVCLIPFYYNPHLVPSIRINGTREPICKACVDKANPLRKEKGLPPINVLPGAYEAMEESLL